MAPGWDNLFHVLNPSDLRRPAVSSFFQTKKWRGVWIDRGSHPTHLETVIDWALNEGVRDLAIWGGDGSFSRAVNRLAQQDALGRIRLALVPAGTCNDFARRLPLPLWDVMTASDAPEFVERRIDVGVIDHQEGRHFFVNNAGFGRKPEAQSGKRPNPVLDILRLEPTPVAIESTGGDNPQHVELQALLGIVFNAPYFGGGLHFSTDIFPDDGRIDGFFVGEQPRWRVLWSFLRARGGRPFSNGRLQRVSGESLRLRTPGWLYPQADGERASKGGVREMTFKVLPKALTLLLPK